MSEYELLLSHGGGLQVPLCLDEIRWETMRKGEPGKLECTLLKTEGLDFQEGDTLRLSVDGTPVFYGYVFTKSRDKQHQIKVTAYDQLRYLKNKDTVVYENKTAAEVVAMLAADYGLKTGALADTGYKIPARSEDNQTLFDIIQTALDLTVQNTGRMYVLYDDFGALTLTDIEEMQLPLLLTDRNAENFDYTTSIDNETYNVVKLVYEDKDAGKREVKTAVDEAHCDQWGILQYFEQVNTSVNLQAHADALLELYNHKTRSLTIKGVFGDPRVRAGNSLIVKLGLGDMDLSSFLVVEKAVHKLAGGHHTMDLTMTGGEFVG